MNFLKGLAGGDGSAEDGGGAGSWLASIKEKSKEIAEVYKRDIGTCCRAGLSIVPGAPAARATLCSPSDSSFRQPSSRRW